VTPGPVFVAGLERTGTSLMYALLASHPRLAMTRRTNLWTHFYGQYGDLGDDANLDRCLATMMRYRRLVKLQPDRERLRREFRAGERTYGRLFALVCEQHAERAGKPRWGDKSLHIERYARPIFEAYPDARILHMIRDPRDRFASSLTRWQQRRGGVGAGTAEWLASARLSLRNARDHPEGYRLIRYETVVSAPEQTMREVCAFIGEPFAPEMLSMRGAPEFLDRGSNSSYGQRAPGTITATSVGRFREVLAPAQVAFVQRLAGDLMEHFGYEADPVPLTRIGRARFAVETVPLETARLLAWRGREAVRDRKGRPVPSYRLVEETLA
jgi:Sulfotransferase family